MKPTIECAYCEGEAHLHSTDKELPFRKEVFKVVEHFYRCKNCGEEFTTTETDTVTLLQAHNQYRAKHFIPFTEEIISLREKYELSASKMSEILALGINGFSNYERGEIPTPAIGNLISTAENPHVFKAMLERSESLFSAGTFDKAMERINYLIHKDTSSDICPILNIPHEPSSYTGFRKLNKDRIANILTLFLTKCDERYNDKLKLNKLLFYVDFANYKYFGASITGLSYRAIEHGPAPTYYSNLYSYFEDESIIKPEWEKIDGLSREIFVSTGDTDLTIFNDNEIYIIETICETFRHSRSWDLVDLSHKEAGWQELHLEKKVIDYQKYAFKVQGA